MKVLQVNSVYKTGSTGKITADVHSGLQKHGIESVVCYGRGKVVREDHVYKVCGEFYSKVNHFMARVTGIMYGGCHISTSRLISVIKKEKPDIVHLQCINGYFVNIYRLVNWLKKNNIKTVVTLHAEFMYTGGCGYSIDCNQWSTRQGCGHSAKCPRWRAETKSMFIDRTGTMWKRMKKAFDGFDKGIIVTAVSPWLMERAELSPIFSGKEHRVVLNGLDRSVFHPITVASINNLKEELGINSEKIIFHATPGFNLNPAHIKGGYYVVELAKQMPDVKFVVAGKCAKGMKVPDNIILLGDICDQNKLAALYSMADLTVLTSRKETFSMVVAESLCCGTPVFGFFAGAPEEIALNCFSEFVEYGDLNALKEVAEDMLQRDFDKKNMMVQAEIYSKDTMTEQYLEIYQQLALCKRGIKQYG